MRNLLIICLFFILATGCKDSQSDMAIMEIVGVYIDGDENNVNYANQFHRMPALGQGDAVDILFSLRGNGNDLHSFIVTNENNDVKTTLFFMGDEVSKDFSDFDQGVLVFVDGVSETGLTVKAIVTDPAEGSRPVSFYLFSKATDCKGAHIELKIPTEVAVEKEE